MRYPPPCASKTPRPSATVPSGRVYCDCRKYLSPQAAPRTESEVTCGVKNCEYPLTFASPTRGIPPPSARKGRFCVAAALPPLTAAQERMSSKANSSSSPWATSFCNPYSRRTRISFFTKNRRRILPFASGESMYPRLSAPDGRLFVIVQGAVVQPHPVRRAPQPAVGKHRRTERQSQFICPRRRHADAGLPVRKEHSVPVGKGDAIGECP